jgi:hypothetical protein
MRAVPVLSRWQELTAARFVLLVAVGAAGPAAALCPGPELKVCSVFFDSDKVFYGKVVRITPVGFDGGAPGPDDLIAKHRYTIAVEQRFKGKVGTVENVVTDNDSGRWHSRLGERRVLFVRDGQVGGLCSPIDEAAHARRTIAQIRALANASDATIEGEIGRGHGTDFIQNYTVTAFGRDGEHKAVTDRNGRFGMRVAPGDYRLANDVTPSDYSYARDVHAFRVVRGQCAQFQLLPRDPR